MNPIELFLEWYEKESAVTTAEIPSACCLSTVGTGGFPNARFVSLKDVSDGCFIVTGSLNSRKAREINRNPKVALTFWWPATEKQVRIQGRAECLSSEKADRFFNNRSREARIVSWVSKQGQPVENMSVLEERYQRFSELYENRNIPRPQNWGGIRIVPVRIEFLIFSSGRFHNRELFTLENGRWFVQKLQP